MVSRLLQGIALAVGVAAGLAVEAKEAAFTAEPVDVFTRVEAPLAKRRAPMSVQLSAWRNERVHAQLAIVGRAAAKGLKLAADDFRASDGSVVPASAVACRFVKSVRAKMPGGVRPVPDLLDPSGPRDLAAGEAFGAWFTVAVPATAKPGCYTGAFTVSAADGTFVRVNAELRVLAYPALPDAKDRKFFLDLWQHPWTVASYYKVKPYSPEHFAKLEPLYRELAAAGQKVILTSVVDLPWSERYGADRDAIRTMVEYVKGEDGKFRADFTNFDAFVAFAKKCGLGPQIHCYTIVKFFDSHIFYYTDGKTGERRAEELYEGTPAYERFLTPLLEQLQAHLVEKGWIDDAYVAIDEVPPERLAKPRAFLKRVAPKLKFAVASNVDPLRYREITKDTDVMSQILWTGHGIKTMFTSEFEKFMSERRARKQITTFYVCTEPQKPNTWLKSPLAETEWIGLYSAAKGYDGFLRWACFLWPEDPFDWTTSPDYYPAGEIALLYPGGLASVRWEILRDAIEDWEKIRLLRESGKMSDQLKAALAEMDFEAMQRADEDDYRESVNAVLRELNRAEDDPAVDPVVAGWEAGGRAKTLHWFRSEFYGYAPGRPADETFSEDGVSFAGGKMKINVHYALPEGASAANPAPVFILLDHYNGAERKDGLWHRPETPTNTITGRGYAYVNINLNDVALNCYDDRWSNKVHRVYGVGKPDDWGTIGAWAWAVSRVVDWIEQRPEMDATRIAVTGHSRGGKTALWAGVQDRRIALAAPNGSGTGGARLIGMNLPDAEPLKWMLENAIRFWYCPNAQKYKECERTLPHDADDMLRLMCPRLVYVGSGSGDAWAGPRGEFEAAKRASDLWRAYGLPGLGAETFPQPGQWSHEGRVGYHLHNGPHELKPWDWNRFLDFADRHMKKPSYGPIANPDDQVRLLWDFEPGCYEQARETGFNMLSKGGLFGTYDFKCGTFHSAWQKNFRGVLEKMAADGIGCMYQMGLPHDAVLRKRHPRVGRDGKVNDRTMDMTRPGAVAEMRVAARQLVANAAKCPNLLGVQTCSEVRMLTEPSFTPEHAAAFKRDTGLDVPPSARHRGAPNWKSLKDIPADRVIASDYAPFAFYRWFWQKDDGFGLYHDMVVEEVGRRFGERLFTEYDPCIRCPPMWGSGGRVSHLADWQTVQPMPFQESYILSKCQAMARVRPDVNVFAFVQAICARNDSSPTNRNPKANAPAWLADRPNGRWITPPPDMHREALWHAFSRKTDGILMHGWNCLFDGAPHGVPKDAGGYQFTNAEDAKAVKELFDTVAIPLGPLFKKMPERAPQVAVWESLAPVLLSGMAPYDWKYTLKTWFCGVATVAANLSPYVLYDDEVFRDGIPPSVKVIILPMADVMERRVVEALAAFRARGGKVLAPEDHAPGLEVDAILPPNYHEMDRNSGAESASRNPSFSAVAYDERMRRTAREFRAAVKDFVTLHADSDNPFVQTWARDCGSGAETLFAINGKRTAGDYIGQWGCTLEKGCPNAAKVTIRRLAGAVYDLVAHTAVPFNSRDGVTEIPVAFETTGGKALLVADRPLGKLTATAVNGGRACSVTVCAEDRDVLIPIEVDIEGMKPYYGVIECGFWTREIDLGKNTGSSVKVRNLATGEGLTIRM